MKTKKVIYCAVTVLSLVISNAMARDYQSSDNENENQSWQQQQDQQQQGQQQHTVTGTIEDMRTTQLTGIQQEHEDFVVARIKTEDGRVAKVCLGPKSQLSRLDLKSGDQITVEGVPGHINDKSMLIATDVIHKGQEISVEMPSSKFIRQVRGQIMGLYTIRFSDFRDQFVIADVRLENGHVRPVILGPRFKIDRLDLQEGDRIALLVRPAHIDGKRAMLAEQIHANGRTMKMHGTEESSSFQTEERGGRSQEWYQGPGQGGGFQGQPGGFQGQERFEGQGGYQGGWQGQGGQGQEWYQGQGERGYQGQGGFQGGQGGYQR